MACSKLVLLHSKLHLCRNVTCCSVFIVISCDKAGPLAVHKMMKHAEELALEKTLAKRDISFQAQTLLESVKSSLSADAEQLLDEVPGTTVDPPENPSPKEAEAERKKKNARTSKTLSLHSGTKVQDDCAGGQDSF
jgi:hypothetical protein